MQAKLMTKSCSSEQVIMLCRGKMRTGAYAVALLNLLLLSYFVCQTLHISLCSNSLFHFGRPEIQRPPTAAAAYPPPQLLARPAEAIFHKGIAAEKSYFLPWIQHDFQLWQPTGITLVRQPQPLAIMCTGLSTTLLQIH